MAAEAAITMAVQLLGDLLIEKVKFLRGVKGKVELLRDELRRMQSFLRDANNKQYEDERVRTWISVIREVAYDTQDTIEMFLTKVSMGMLGDISSPKKYYYLNKTGKEIDSILVRLEAINKSRETYGIKDLGEAAEPAWRLQVEDQRRLDHWQIDQDMVGVEDDIKTLLKESILNEKKGLSVAVLEGMGGIGKSTLARAIYNHPDVIATGRFDCRGWVVVSSDFTPIETIKQLIFQLQTTEDQRNQIDMEIKRLEESTKDQLYHLKEVRHMLYKQLEGKSYLIVLDDVWEKPHFQSLITAFPHEQDKKSRILITTREKNIANPGGYVHNMKLLDPLKSWELLLKKANIGGPNGECPTELESVGRQILEKCGRLPLAISVVGGLLVETDTKIGWEKILSQINSYLGRHDSSVSAVLEQSYMNLSPQLKSCFLCLAFFKEDATISAKYLENIWITQGFIQREGSIRLDEIARSYLNELINRSMIQIQDLRFDDQVENCCIHDLVRDVCIRKAEEEISLEIVKGGGGVSSSVKPSKPRHRIVYGNNLEISKENKHVRSLFLLNVNHDGDYVSSAPTHFWRSFRLLKTLHLEGFGFERFPESFRLLIELKILRILHKGHGSKILTMPSWLNKLKNLEVLKVENAIVDFSNVALKMERLRHLEVYDSIGINIKNCKSLEILRMIHIERWVKYSSTVMANSPLRELQIRVDVFTSQRDDGMLSMIRVSWEKMTNLVELHLYFSLSTEYPISRIPLSSRIPLREVIPHLDSITILRVTYLKSPRSTTPASMFPPNLCHLILDSCNVCDNQLIEFGKLPKLQYLALIDYDVNSDYLERMVVLPDHFPSLQVLYLQDMWALKSIDIEEGGMPRLKQLKISSCYVLKTENLPKHITLIKD